MNIAVQWCYYGDVDSRYLAMTFEVTIFHFHLFNILVTFFRYGHECEAKNNARPLSIFH